MHGPVPQFDRERVGEHHVRPIAHVPTAVHHRADRRAGELDGRLRERPAGDGVHQPVTRVADRRVRHAGDGHLRQAGLLRLLVERARHRRRRRHGRPGAGHPVISVDEVLGPGGLLSRAVAGWEPRDEQLEMASAVAAALRANRPLLVEAGTGTGKTLAYLVPAILSGLKVVVSTGTKNLQEQILKKDIPLLSESLPVSFTATALKGINNYLCIRRFNEHDSRLRARGDDTLQLNEVREWAERTLSGDRAELPDLPDDAPLWREISSTTETRLGARCPHFEQCHVTRARREAQSADLIIVNHHLFFADLSLKSQWPQAQLLPSYEAVIFDEAHQLEDVATDYFGLGVSSLRLGGLHRDLQRAVDAMHLDARLSRTAEHFAAVADELWASLRPRLPRDGRAAATDDTWRGEPTRAWHAVDTA